MPPVGERTPGRPLPAPDTGPVETVRDLIATGVVLLLAFVTRFWGLNSATDGGTPIFRQQRVGGATSGNPFHRSEVKWPQRHST